MWGVTTGFTMLHSNIGEVHQLLSTFNRVWGAGGEASLSLKTVDGKVSAVLEVQLGPPTSLRPGAPEACQQAAGSVPPAAWSTPPTASWSWTPGTRCCSAGSLEEAPSGKPASPTAATNICCWNPSRQHCAEPCQISWKAERPWTTSEKAFQMWTVRLLFRHQARSERAQRESTQTRTSKWASTFYM